MMVMSTLAPNHHADHPQFSGLLGHLAGLTMTVGRQADGRLAIELASLAADHDVVDIGCGPGAAARMAAGSARSVVGVDPSEPMLRLARLITRVRRPGGTVAWHRAGAENLGLPDRSADVCWSLASVHHWPDLDRSLAEVRRVLRPGGRFVAMEKRTPPGASGAASHGWTDEQADTMAGLLDALGFIRTEVSTHDLGRRRVVAVTADAGGEADGEAGGGHTR